MELSDTIFYAVLAFLWITYLWESYLEYRQRYVYKTVVKLPDNVEKVMDEETFTKARLYNLDCSNFRFWSGLYSQLETTLILSVGVIPWAWSKCVEHTIALGYTGEHGLIISMLFIAYSSIFSFVDGILWSLYKTFIIEEKHGFNKQTLGFFVKDKLKSLILTLVLSMPITAGLLYIIQWGGQYFYIYTWLFTLVVTIFFMFVYPNWIAPLFDRYEPLPDGELKEEIEKMAKSIQFPLTKLFVVEGSKRSNHSNAYFYGFWKNKRIVLFDTLIEGFVFPKKEDKEEVEDKKADETTEKKEKTKKGCKNDEVLAILGHELGHWKLGHINYNLLISNVNIFFMFFLFGQLLKADILFVGFGFDAGTAPLLIKLIVIFQFIFSPYNELTSFLMTLLTRRFEFQADNFAVEMKRGDQLASGLIKLLSDNLSFPINDWLYSSYNFSHPPLLERLAAAREATKKVK